MHPLYRCFVWHMFMQIVLKYGHNSALQDKMAIFKRAHGDKKRMQKHVSTPGVLYVHILLKKWPF